MLMEASDDVNLSLVRRCEQRRNCQRDADPAEPGRRKERHHSSDHRKTENDSYPVQRITNYRADRGVGTTSLPSQCGEQDATDVGLAAVSQQCHSQGQADINGETNSPAYRSQPVTSACCQDRDDYDRRCPEHGCILRCVSDSQRQSRGYKEELTPYAFRQNDEPYPQGDEGDGHRVVGAEGAEYLHRAQHGEDDGAVCSSAAIEQP